MKGNHVDDFSRNRQFDSPKTTLNSKGEFLTNPKILPIVLTILLLFCPVVPNIESNINPLSVNATKWSNRLKQLFSNDQRIV